MAFCRTIISVSRTFNFLSCFTQNGTNKTRRLFKCISNFHFHLLTHFYHFVFLPCESFMHSVIKCEKYNHWHSSKCSNAVAYRIQKILCWKKYTKQFFSVVFFYWDQFIIWECMQYVVNILFNVGQQRNIWIFRFENRELFLLHLKW